MRHMLTKDAGELTLVKKVVDPEFAKVRVEDTPSDGFPAGYVEGYASVFNNVDLVGDVVTPGAFGKSLRERLKKGMILLYDSHMVFDGTDAVIGVVRDAKEDDYGLWFKALFSSVQRAQDVRTKIKEGILSAVSFGYDVIKAEPGPNNTTLLKELRLHEVSIVPWGANPKAQVEGVKRAVPPEPEPDPKILAADEEARRYLKGLQETMGRATVDTINQRFRTLSPRK